MEFCRSREMFLRNIFACNPSSMPFFYFFFENSRFPKYWFQRIENLSKGFLDIKISMLLFYSRKPMNFTKSLDNKNKGLTKPLCFNLSHQIRNFILNYHRHSRSDTLSYCQKLGHKGKIWKLRKVSMVFY